MTDLKSIYTVYMDNNVIGKWAALIRTEAKKHRESGLKVEKTETMFDTSSQPRDKLSLNMIRNPRKSNAIRASIHQEDW
jgi:hypothetical protein